MNPVTLTIMATRHFRTLPHRRQPRRADLRRARPRPCDATGAQLGRGELETALAVLTETDLKLRSAGQHAPALALVERAFIRLAMLGAQR